jgi:hypothetical protein
MEDWTEALETIANGIEQFFEDLGKGMGEAMNGLIEFADDVAEELEQTISPSLEQFDQQVAEWLEPVLFALTGLEASIDRAVEPMSHTVEPLLNQHPICMGCRHYHGHTYNGVMLVCAMHPYGIVDGADTCPDKENIAWKLPPAADSTDELF